MPSAAVGLDHLGDLLEALELVRREIQSFDYLGRVVVLTASTVTVN